MRHSTIVVCRSETTELNEVLEGCLCWVPYEIIIVIARDATKDCILTALNFRSRHKEAKIEIINQKDRGCGAAYRLGIMQAQGDVCCLVEGDGEADYTQIPAMLKKYRGSPNCMMLVAERKKFIGYGLIKLALNRTFNFFARRLLKTHVKDLTYSFKLVATFLAQNLSSAKENVFHKQDFNAYLTMMAIALGHEVETHPVVWRARQGTSETSFSLSQSFCFLRPLMTALRVKRGAK